jgi:xylan 1,4-beta-xylosidase
VLNVFRMFAKMEGRRVPVSSTGEVPLGQMLASGVRDRPDVAAIASRSDTKLSVMIWHYHDDDVAGPDAAIRLAIDGLGGAARDVVMRHYRVDQSHSNSYAEWKRLGSPLAPSEAVYAQLEKAGQLTLVSAPTSVRVARGRMSIDFELPRQGVSLIEVAL